ncbi:hypothetical protein PVW46_18695 [Mameliella sp. AT18]|nr:hypothetical protein [Mameliella sp. AT18]
MHYGYQEPKISVSIKDGTETPSFYYDSYALFRSGYDWKRDSRDFLRGQPDGRIDLIKTNEKAIQNIEKQLELHHRVINRKLHAEKQIHDAYLNCYNDVKRGQSAQMRHALKLNRHWQKRLSPKE